VRHFVHSIHVLIKGKGLNKFLANQVYVFFTIAIFMFVGVFLIFFVLHPAEPKFWGRLIWIGSTGIACVASFWFAKQRKKRFLNSRQTLSDEDIYLQYFSESGLSQPLVHELWQEVADAFRLPSGKLRPTDRFGNELGGYWIVSDEVDILTKIAVERAKRHSIKLELSEIKTLGEYVKRFGDLESEK